MSAIVVGGALFGEDDYQCRLMQMAASLGIASQVEFTGHVVDPKPYFERSDIAVHASTIPEPFGITVVEAMWAGSAVVASASGGPLEIISSGRDGILTPMGDVDALSVALMDLVADRDRRMDLGINARHRARKFDVRLKAKLMREWLLSLTQDGVQPLE